MSLLMLQTSTFGAELGVDEGPDLIEVIAQSRKLPATFRRANSYLW